MVKSELFHPFPVPEYLELAAMAAVYDSDGTCDVVPPKISLVGNGHSVFCGFVHIVEWIALGMDCFHNRSCSLLMESVQHRSQTQQ